MSHLICIDENGVPVYGKTPGEALDYGFSGNFLYETNEQNDSVTWQQLAGTATIDAQFSDAKQTRIDISGGAVGDPDNHFRATMNTMGGATDRTYVRDLKVRIVDQKGA